MEELKRNVTQVGPVLGVDAHALCQIHSRLLWSDALIESAHKDLLVLLRGLPIDQALWRPITVNLADTNTYLKEALAYFVGDDHD